VSIVDNEFVREAIEAAVAAGVPKSQIDAAIEDAVAGPQDGLTEPILSGRLYGLVRTQAMRRAPWPPPLDVEFDFDR
jgi:hypothetical protein